MTTRLKVIPDLRSRVFTLADWDSYYYSRRKLDPQVEEILQGTCPFYPRKRVFETHFAFVGLPGINGDPLTVAKWLELNPPTGKLKFYYNTNPWHAGQPYTDVATLESRLYIMLRNIVPGSTNSTPEEQVAMLPGLYEVPTTIAEVTKDILLFRKTGKRSNPSHWASCLERTVMTSVTFPGYVSCVGSFFGNIGLRIGRWSGSRGSRIGVGASRILNLKSLGV